MGAKRSRGLKLAAAAVLAVGAGGAFLYQVLQGVSGLELLEFTTVYIAGPLILALLLMFSCLAAGR